MSASYSFKFVASGLHTSTDKGVSNNTKRKYMDDALACVSPLLKVLAISCTNSLTTHASLSKYEKARNETYKWPRVLQMRPLFCRTHSSVWSLGPRQVWVRVYRVLAVLIRELGVFPEGIQRFMSGLCIHSLVFPAG